MFTSPNGSPGVFKYIHEEYGPIRHEWGLKSAFSIFL